MFTLSTADRPYRMFVEHMRDGAATVSSNGLILYANRRLGELLSCSTETIVGAPLTRFMSGADPGRLERRARPFRRGRQPVPVLVGSSLLEVDGDQLTCLTFTDLTAQKAQEREIARLSQAQAARLAELQAAQAALTEQVTHDALTGLPNRALIVDRIEQALAASKRSRQCTAVLFVDLDIFKHVNDTRGHAAGDTLLQRVAERLVGVLRPMDTVGRIGGDEFIVLAPEVDGHLYAADLGARLIAELNREDENGQVERVAASIGISVSVAGRGTAETLLHEADTAMYRAKSLGGARAEMFDAALGRQAKKRLRARRTLDAALDEQRIAVHFQPLVDLPSAEITGFEALARIAERDGSLLPPADFIPVAEDSGLVVPLGAKVLTLACRQAQQWQPRDRGARPDRRRQPLLPAVRLRRPVVGGQVDARAHRAGAELPASRAHRDGDHGPAPRHPAAARADQGPRCGDGPRRLRDRLRLAHDLRRLPLSFVKIDQSFVQGLGTDREDERIVSAVIDLAANLGLRSIAEGVETGPARSAARPRLRSGPGLPVRPADAAGPGVRGDRHRLE